MRPQGTEDGNQEVGRSVEAALVQVRIFPLTLLGHLMSGDTAKKCNRESNPILFKATLCTVLLPTCMFFNVILYEFFKKGLCKQV